MARLSALRPDRQRLIALLQEELATNTFDPTNPQVQQVWNALLKVSTGRKIVGFFGTIGEYAQYAIERAYNERNIETAELESSIRAIVRSMSVRMSRKLPPGIRVTLTRDQDAGTIATTSLTLPRFVAFSSGSLKMYNRESLTFAAGESIKSVMLYAGEVVSSTFESDGSDFQTFVSREAGFIISDGVSIDNSGNEIRDVEVKINGTPVKVSSQGLWSHKATVDPAVQDRTLSTGELEILFGTDEYGIKPAVGETVTVRYVLTNGSIANNPSFSDAITVNNSTLYPVLVSYDNNGLTGGADEVSAETYRAAGPLLFAAFERAVTGPDWNAMASTYPGVIDALVLGQRDTYPNDRRYMNVLSVCTLKADGTTLTVPEFETFWTWMSNKINPNLIPRKIDPIPSNPAVSLRLYCASHVDLELAKFAVQQAIAKLFALGYASIGRTIHIGDIIYAARTAIAGVKHVQVVAPTVDIVTRARGTRVSVTQEDGALTSGYYNYAVVPEVQIFNGSTLATEMGGRTRVSTYIAPAANKNVKLSWAPVTGALNYHIYGRSVGEANMGLMATVGSDVLSFLDNGSITPDMTTGNVLTDVPPPNEAFRFPKLGQLTVSCVYEDVR